MKILKLITGALLVLLTSVSALAQDEFTLTVNNDTQDTFNLSSAPPKSLDTLNPGQQNKVYTLGYMGTPKKFALLFTSTGGQKTSIYYLEGGGPAAPMPPLQCNSQSFYYHCLISNATQNSGTLTISYNS